MVYLKENIQRRLGFQWWLLSFPDFLVLSLMENSFVDENEVNYLILFIYMYIIIISEIDRYAYIPIILINSTILSFTSWMK